MLLQNIRSHIAHKFLSYIELNQLMVDLKRFGTPVDREILGLTIETVSRQLTKLRQAKVINLTDNRLVEVPNLDRLKALAEVEP